MSHRRLFTLSLAAALAVSSVTAAFASTTAVVTPDAPQGWTEVNIRGAGTSLISEDVPDSRGGTGSLRQATSGSADKTDFQLLAELGPLAELDALSFEWYRDSSSTAAGHLTPAVGLYVSDGVDSWLLKWEGVYNGYPTNGPAVPTDEWVEEDLLTANYWRIPQFIDGAFVGIRGCAEPGNPYACFVFDRQLDDAWLDGFELVGVELGVGSGWAGSFLGYVDLLTIGDVTYDFEVATQPADVVLEGPDKCKDGGWATSTSPEFRNQGQCVSFFVANARAGR